jgi:cytoplasmic iron level regulating protein YaaA (DUF328/UPF0246 family)
VFILLPPSEGKAPVPSRGRPLDVDALSLPALTPARKQLVTALERLAQGPRGAAVTALGLTAGLAGEVDKDAVLTTAPAMPAARLYSGVLYDALDIASLDAAARRRANRSILISSALFGSVHLTDRIPSYRLSMAARLPRMGTVASVWRAPLAEALPDHVGDSLVLDLRSGPYAAMWRPVRARADRLVTVRVLHEAIPGDRSSRSIVSHFNKATKGRLVRSLVQNAQLPRTADELRELLTSVGWTVEAGPEGRSPSLDVIVADV